MILNHIGNFLLSSGGGFIPGVTDALPQPTVITGSDVGLTIIKVIAIIILAPLVGGLLSGLDRIISAKMQLRKGPPLLQPFYDVIKLFHKKSTTVNNMTRYFVTLSMFFSFFTVVLFCLGMDLLLCVFSFTLACVFFVLVGFSSYSPFAFAGTNRELIQIMCYEPMILLVAFGFFQATSSFSVSDAFQQSSPIIEQLPFMFVGLLYVLTIKLRKSPFDLSMSHHGHQELVKGITTELTGSCMGMVEINHWLETIFGLGLVYLFFVTASPVSWVVAAVLTLVVFFIEIIIDNVFARIKWKFALQLSWIVVFVTGGANLLLLNMFVN